MRHKNSLLAVILVPAALLLSGCSKEATITARTGVGGSQDPYIKCEVVMLNPDYSPLPSTPTPASVRP